MWRVVQANAGLVTEYEVLQLLRQRGLRTPEEEAEAAERRAAAAVGEAADDADLAAAAPEALYPQMNPPFAVERAVRPPRRGVRRSKPWRRPPRAPPRSPLSPLAALQVFERLSRGPAAKQDPEKLAQFVSLVTARARSLRCNLSRLCGNASARGRMSAPDARASPPSCLRRRTLS